MDRATRNRIPALLAALAILLTALPRTAAAAQPPPSIRTAVFAIGSTAYTVDGRVYRMDAAPLLVNGTALVPLRYLAAGLGIPDGSVSYQPRWGGKTGFSAVDLYRNRSDGSQIDVTVYFNPADPAQDGFAPHGTSGLIGIRFETRPLILAGRLMVPVRDVAGALGAFSTWNGATRQVTVKTWETLPAAAGDLAADQVAMQPEGRTITALTGGEASSRRLYPFPVEIANPYYQGPEQPPDLYALLPTLEAFGVPARNILWDPATQTMAIAGSSPMQFIYFTAGPGVHDNLTDEFAVDLDPPDLGPSVSLVRNGVLYTDDTVDLILVFGFNLQLTDEQGNGIDPIIQEGAVLKA